MGSKKTRRQSSSLPKPHERAEVSPPEKAPLVLTAPKTIVRHKHAQALELVFAEALAEDEGLVAGAVGVPRFGKTYWLNEVLAHGFAVSTWRQAFIHDVKKRVPQYEGAVAANAADWIARWDAFKGQARTVFHSAQWDEKPSLQDVCAVARVVAEEDIPLVVVADEIYNGTDGYRNWLPGPPDENGKPEPALCPWMMREGTSQRISTLWTTQIPQELPTQARTLSSSVAMFHLEGLAADAGCEHFRLEGDGPAILKSLRKGEFVLFLRNREWNRVVYEPETSL
jgi:hypothetical protein